MKLHYKFCFLIIGLLSISCSSFRPSYIQYKDGVYNDDIDSKEYTDYKQRRQRYQSRRQPRKTITPTDYKSYFQLKSLEYQSKSLGKLDIQSPNTQKQFLNPSPSQDRRLQSRYQHSNPNLYDHFYASYYGLGWNVPMGYVANYGMNPYDSMTYGYYSPYWGLSWGWPASYNYYWGRFGGYYNLYWGWRGGYGGYYGSYYGNNYYNNSVRRNVDRHYSRTDLCRNYSENYNVGRRSSYDSNKTPNRPIPSRSNNSYYTPSSNSYQRSSAPSYRSFGNGGGARSSSDGYNAGRR